MSIGRTTEGTSLELTLIGSTTSSDSLSSNPIQSGTSTRQLNQQLLETKEAEDKSSRQIVHYSDPAAPSYTTNDFIRGFAFLGTALLTAAGIIYGTDDWSYEDNISLSLATPGAIFLFMAVGAKLNAMCERSENRTLSQFNPNEEYVIPVSEEDISQINNPLPQALVNEPSNGHRIIEVKSAPSEQKAIITFFKATDQPTSLEPANSPHRTPTVAHK